MVTFGPIRQSVPIFAVGSTKTLPTIPVRELNAVEFFWRNDVKYKHIPVILVLQFRWIAWPDLYTEGENHKQHFLATIPIPLKIGRNSTENSIKNSTENSIKNSKENSTEISTENFIKNSTTVVYFKIVQHLVQLFSPAGHHTDKR